MSKKIDIKSIIKHAREFCADEGVLDSTREDFAYRAEEELLMRVLF
ncbi:MAG: hypothetical protein ACRC0F_00270 [Cetobacterium sp.]